MGFLIDTNKTKKIFFNNKLEVSEKETENYIEIISEPSIEIVEDIKKAIKPKNIKVSANQELSLDTENMGSIPIIILGKIIKNWSEKETVTVNLLKTKVHPKILRNLWDEILTEYGLDFKNAIGI